MPLTSGRVGPASATEALRREREQSDAPNRCSRSGVELGGCGGRSAGRRPEASRARHARTHREEELVLLELLVEVDVRQSRLNDLGRVGEIELLVSTSRARQSIIGRKVARTTSPSASAGHERRAVRQRTARSKEGSSGEPAYHAGRRSCPSCSCRARCRREAAAGVWSSALRSGVARARDEAEAGRTELKWPSSEVPPENGVIGMRYRFAIWTTFWTSPVLCERKEGGGGSRSADCAWRGRRASWDGRRTSAPRRRRSASAPGGSSTGLARMFGRSAKSAHTPVRRAGGTAARRRGGRGARTDAMALEVGVVGRDVVLAPEPAKQAPELVDALQEVVRRAERRRVRGLAG